MSKNTDVDLVLYENHGQDSRIKAVDKSPQINAKAGTGGGNLPLAMINNSIRRLTPGECSKLQGFPPDYTEIPYKGKPADKCPDGPRYKAIGNSWAVPCARWIGERIMKVETALTKQIP